MKSFFRNWKCSLFILVTVIIFNIVFLCLPVFGTYAGVTRSSWDRSYDTKIKFNNGITHIEYSAYDGDEKEYSYFLGLYQKVDDEIVIIRMSTNYDSATIYRDKYKRQSVFTLTKNDNEFTSTSAILMQVGFAIIEFVFILRFIAQLTDKDEVTIIKVEEIN